MLDLRVEGLAVAERDDEVVEIDVRVADDDRDLVELAELLADLDQVVVLLAVDGLRPEQDPAGRIERRLVVRRRRRRLIGRRVVLAALGRRLVAPDLDRGVTAARDVPVRDVDRPDLAPALAAAEVDHLRALTLAEEMLERDVERLLVAERDDERVQLDVGVLDDDGERVPQALADADLDLIVIDAAVDALLAQQLPALVVPHHRVRGRRRRHDDGGRMVRRRRGASADDDRPTSGSGCRTRGEREQSRAQEQGRYDLHAPFCTTIAESLPVAPGAGYTDHRFTVTGAGKAGDVYVMVSTVAP